MGQRRYTTEQMIAKLREVEHLCSGERTLAEALRCVEISESTYYRWREKFGWMTSDEYLKMRKLKEENKRLRQIVQMWNRTFQQEGLPQMRAEGPAQRKRNKIP